MAELMTVIAVVGVLAAASAPTFFALRRDARIVDAANEVANIYRFARTRALGRGSAVMVIYDDDPGAVDVGNATFLVREAIAGDRTGETLTLNDARGKADCTGTNWAAGNDENRWVTQFDHRRVRYAGATVVWRDAVGAVTDSMVCFTPRGQSFINNANTIPPNTWQVMNQVPRVEVTNPNDHVTNVDDITYFVILPPTGAAKVVTLL